MSKGAENYKNELIKKFKEYSNREKEADKKIGVTASSLWKTEKRKISQVFEKNFHEPIDKYIKG